MLGHRYKCGLMSCVVHSRWDASASVPLSLVAQYFHEFELLSVTTVDLYSLQLVVLFFSHLRHVSVDVRFARLYMTGV